MDEITDITQDYFYKKKIIILQRKKGYRFSVDAPILADFLPSCPLEEALEVGTGCGIISMLALYKKKFAKIVGMEIQEKLSRLARLNAEKNGFNRQFQPVHGDFNERYKDFSGIKTIFSNPPFFETHRGRLSPNEEIRDAKTETKLKLKDLLIKSRAILGKESSLYLILPYDRWNDLIKISRGIGLFPRKIREVFSFKDGKPGRFLVQLTTNDVSPEKMGPLIIFKEKGIYTDEMDRILTG
jgi:tRNA1(Val) A37 N6-methylase TrmN6